MEDVLKNLFEDIKDGDNVFKNIQVRENDELQQKVQLTSPTQSNLQFCGTVSLTNKKNQILYIQMK